MQRFDLSIKDKPVKPPNRKRNRECIWNPFSMNLSLSWRLTQDQNPQMDKDQIRTKKDGVNDTKTTGKTTNIENAIENAYGIRFR